MKWVGGKAGGWERGGLVAAWMGLPTRTHDPLRQAGHQAQEQSATRVARDHVYQAHRQNDVHEDARVERTPMSNVRKELVTRSIATMTIGWLPVMCNCIEI